MHLSALCNSLKYVLHYNENKNNLQINQQYNHYLLRWLADVITKHWMPIFYPVFLYCFCNEQIKISREWCQRD